MIETTEDSDVIIEGIKFSVVTAMEGIRSIDTINIHRCQGLKMTTVS